MKTILILAIVFLCTPAYGYYGNHMRYCNNNITCAHIQSEAKQIWETQKFDWDITKACKNQYMAGNNSDRYNYEGAVECAYYLQKYRNVIKIINKDSLGK